MGAQYDNPNAQLTDADYERNADCWDAPKLQWRGTLTSSVDTMEQTFVDAGQPSCSNRFDAGGFFYNDLCTAGHAVDTRYGTRQKWWRTLHSGPIEEPERGDNCQAFPGFHLGWYNNRSTGLTYDAISEVHGGYPYRWSADSEPYAGQENHCLYGNDDSQYYDCDSSMYLFASSSLTSTIGGAFSRICYCGEDIPAPPPPPAPPPGWYVGYFGWNCQQTCDRLGSGLACRDGYGPTSSKGSTLGWRQGAPPEYGGSWQEVMTELGKTGTSWWTGERAAECGSDCEPCSRIRGADLVQRGDPFETDNGYLQATRADGGRSVPRPHNGPAWLALPPSGTFYTGPCTLLPSPHPSRAQIHAHAQSSQNAFASTYSLTTPHADFQGRCDQYNGNSCTRYDANWLAGCGYDAGSEAPDADDDALFSCEVAPGQFDRDFTKVGSTYYPKIGEIRNWKAPVCHCGEAPLPPSPPPRPPPLAPPPPPMPGFYAHEYRQRVEVVVCS